MFCQGCGAEVGTQSVCAVCGRSTGGLDDATGDTNWSLSLTDSSHRLPQPRNAVASESSPEHRLFATTEDIAPQSLVPDDTTARVAIAAACGMAADLWLPWELTASRHISPASVNLAVTVTLALLLVSPASVLFRPRWRNHPVLAALPMLAGAFWTGAGVLMWGGLTWLSYQRFTATSPLTVNRYQMGPDTGIYLFLVGSVLLCVTGFRTFRATVPALADSSVERHAAIPVEVPVVGTDVATTETSTAETLTPAHPVPSDPALLPGTPGWTAPPGAPVISRPTSGGWRVPIRTRR